jgi:hypothetical protein
LLSALAGWRVRGDVVRTRAPGTENPPPLPSVFEPPPPAREPAEPPPASW